MTSSPPKFKPIYAEFWQDFDAWDSVNPMNCWRFKDGYAQLARGGYWFPYQRIGWTDKIQVNMVKPHVLV